MALKTTPDEHDSKQKMEPNKISTDNNIALTCTQDNKNKKAKKKLLSFNIRDNNKRVIINPTLMHSNSSICQTCPVSLPYNPVVPVVTSINPFLGQPLISNLTYLYPGWNTIVTTIPVQEPIYTVPLPTLPVTLYSPGIPVCPYTAALPMLSPIAGTVAPSGPFYSPSFEDAVYKTPVMPPTTISQDENTNFDATYETSLIPSTTISQHGYTSFNATYETPVMPSSTISQDGTNFDETSGIPSTTTSQDGYTSFTQDSTNQKANTSPVRSRDDIKILEPEAYLLLPRDLFPAARAMSIDPNPIIDEFCRATNIEKHSSWILDLEFGVPRQPVTRPIAIYDVQMNSIHCKNTPQAIHPGFESCSQEFKRVILFYYDYAFSSWYKGYMITNNDKSVANFQSWLQFPIEMFGMCWR